MKQNKQGAPYWRVSLANLCRMVSGLRQESWSGEEQEDGEMREGSLQLLEELYSLQHICRALQSREERVRQTHSLTHRQTVKKNSSCRDLIATSFFHVCCHIRC